MRTKRDIIVFKDSYFEGKTICTSMSEAKDVIHANPGNHVRVQIGSYRLLLKPIEGMDREIDGMTDRALTYEYFNNITVCYKTQIIYPFTYRDHQIKKVPFQP